MDNIDKLLEYVRKTNPKMDKKTLIEELGKNRYSSVALVMIVENIRQES